MVLLATYFNGYVSDIEIMWVLIAAFGAVFSIHNIRESMIDIKALKIRKISNGRWKIATTALRNEIGRLTIQVLFFLVGIDAMTYQQFPNPPHEPLHMQLTRFLFTWGFVLSSIILSFTSYWNYKLRHDLIEHGIQLEPYETEPDKKP